MKQRFFLTVFSSMLVLASLAQNEAVVKSFTLTNDHIAMADRRKDLNGKYCALIKVQVVEDIRRVEGNKIGKVVTRGVEKWIYMCKGSRNVRIHFEKHLPVKVSFPDYKINGLESNRVYELVIETDEEKNKVQQSLVINYSPIDATVLIDSKMYKGDNGRLEVKLPVGEHSYTISALGYVSAEGVVVLNKQAPRELTEKLVSEHSLTMNSVGRENANREEANSMEATDNQVMVGVNGNLLTLDVNPSSSRIKIDGKVFEADERGELTVPVLYGVHVVEIEAEGYVSDRVSVNVNKKDVSKKIRLKKLKEEKSKKGVLSYNKNNSVEIGKTGNRLIINLKYVAGMKIFIDDEEVKLGASDNIKVIDFVLPYGTHEFKAECSGYESENFSVNIGASEVKRTVSLKKKKGSVTGVFSSGHVPNDIIPGQNGNELRLDVTPKNAIVKIDGSTYVLNGRGQLNIGLSFGFHTIVVEADGFESKQITINVGSSVVKNKVRLKKL